MSIIERTGEWADELDRIESRYIQYNPLHYAKEMHEAYLRRYATRGVKFLIVGMNPGPWGMVQTGVPFGEVGYVRDFLKMDYPISQPEEIHPKRPVTGLACTRSEVSGKRVWGALEQLYGTADALEGEVLLSNWCALAFINRGESPKNITPDKLLKKQRELLDRICSDYIRDVERILKPGKIVGVGRFVERKLVEIFPDREIGYLIHPSPANPRASKGWREHAVTSIKQWGLSL